MAKVLIIMGSDSDLPVMSEAANVLKELGVAFKLTVVSAHRTPLRMYDYAQSAHTTGIKVIIAGAGGAAHLPGMVASLTPIPVIGVPVKSKTMNGLDSLYSIVQMPPGIPVASMAINGSKNAGLLAAKILATSDEDLQLVLEEYTQKMQDSVLDKAGIIEEIGYEAYLEKMK